MATEHRVTATLIVAKTDDGETYLRKGALLPVGVSAEEAARLLESGLVEKVSGSAETAEPTIPDGDPAKSWKVPQLRAYAEREGIDLGSAKSKAEVLAALGVDGAESPPADGDGGESPPAEGAAPSADEQT